MNTLKRCVVYPKDVMAMTGRSERYCQILLSKARKFFKKKPKQFVSIEEFSRFSGIPVREVEKYFDAKETS
jgi:hypothetical protein